MTNSTDSSASNPLDVQDSISLLERFSSQRKIPPSYLFLYCFPVYVNQQKVWILGDLEKFLNAYYIYQDILARTWSGVLEG